MELNSIVIDKIRPEICHFTNDLVYSVHFFRKEINTRPRVNVDCVQHSGHGVNQVCGVTSLFKHTIAIEAMVWLLFESSKLERIPQYRLDFIISNSGGNVILPC